MITNFMNIYFYNLQVLSTGVLIAGTWLAADKASFINTTLNITTSEYHPVSSADSADSAEAEKILQVI
jgi:hypothetical protein